jgi:hypothetical protein
MAQQNWQDADLDDDEIEVQGGDVSPEEYTPEQERVIKVFAQDFYSDVKALAIQYMEHFFQDKMLHCGGKIPKSLLFSERRVSMVLNYDIIKGIERAYKYLEPMLRAKDVEAAKQTGEATDDIKLVNETLSLLARSGVPQQFAGGMMCLYLEFIEGINIGTEP